MKLPLARLTSNLAPIGAAIRVVLNSETRIRMAIMIEPRSCGELASETSARYLCSRREDLREQNRRSARHEIRIGNPRSRARTPWYLLQLSPGPSAPFDIRP